LKVKQAVQVSLTLEENDTRKREIDGLLDAYKDLKVKNFLIITEDEEGEEKAGDTKIKITPLWKWLLPTQKMQHNLVRIDKLNKGNLI